jgi:beta-phosphoglucomutase-like phosphatase (HAD superfamily)
VTQRKRAALFDVDGALVDTNYHVTAWWQAFGWGS